MCFGGDDSAKKAAQQAREREELRRSRIATGTASIDAALLPFGDQFFQEQQTAFQQNALPGLGQKFGDAQQQLIFALSRGNLLNSTVGAKRQRRLGEQRAGFERDITSQAIGFANQGRRGVEDTRRTLINQLNATENPALAASASAREAGLLQAPRDFGSVGDFAFDAARGLQDISRFATGGRGFVNRGPTSNFSTGGNRGSSRDVRVG